MTTTTPHLFRVTGHGVEHPEARCSTPEELAAFVRACFVPGRPLVVACVTTAGFTLDDLERVFSAGQRDAIPGDVDAVCAEWLELLGMSPRRDDPAHQRRLTDGVIQP